MALSQTSGACGDLASYRKVATLYFAIRDGFEIEYLERILQKEGSINYDVKNSHKIADCGLLHSAYVHASFQVFDLLLNHGADFTVDDSEGHTIVHKIIQKQYNTPEFSYDEYENQFVDSVISAHVKFGNNSNPSCKHNISHFHVACMRNNAEAVEFFLKNGVDANQAVYVNSPIFAGYTPLHFAVQFSCQQAIEILLKLGVNARLKNAIGMNPLDILIERKVNGRIYEKKDVDEHILELLAKHVVNDEQNADDFDLTNFHVACIIKDISVVKSIFDEVTDVSIVNRSVPINSPVCPGYTPLHFAAIFSVESFELLLNKGADIEAKDANNETPFDIYLHKHGVKDIQCIISSQTRWKNITLSDDKTKLLDLVSAMTSVEELGKFLANVESIVDLKVPADSPLWPGYTILHLAVVFSEKAKGEPNYYGYTSDTKKVEECTNRGADITKADANGSTALHLAFYLQKFRTVEVLLKHHLTPENPLDKNNLSHFHIACAARAESAVERFLSNGVDVNAPTASSIEWHVLVRSHLDCKPRYLFLPAGSTALHINVACGNIDITKMLLENGADVYAKDINGFTAIHRLLTSCITRLEEGLDGFLLAPEQLRDSTTENGLSHLHVATRLDQYSAVEKLLNSGADINAVVTYDATIEFVAKDDYFFDPYGDPSGKPLSFLSRYSGFTPLHFSVQACNVQIQKLLMRRGADVLAGSSSSCVPLRKIFEDADEYSEIILLALKNNSALKNRLKDQLGLTMLHIACYANKLELVNDLLLEGEDVNARVDKKSPIWPGNTPLHIAAMNVPRLENSADLIRIFKLLLENGANITSANEDGDTPLHLISNLYDGPLARCECACLLLETLKDFDISAAHSQKMTFFHFACLMKNLLVVREYLKNGIDINRAVDLFADRYAGCSPLHLAAGYGKHDIPLELSIVGLLLKHGADVHVKDVYENTPLHSAAGLMTYRHVLFDMFIRSGVDVNAENIRGETALEVLIKSLNAHWVEIECLLKHGSRINSFNSITHGGYIARVLNDLQDYEWKAVDDDVIQCLVDSEYVNEIDGAGRTILHNLVSISKVNITDYVELIEKFVKRGCDINHQDKEGRTALHTATWFRNNQGVLGLMKNGADINVTDKQGKTAFTYSFEPPSDRNSFENYSDTNHVINIFAMHVHKMKSCGLYVSEVNQRLQVNALEMYYLNEDILNEFEGNKETAKNIKMGSTALSLFDFGFKIDAEMIYPGLSLLERLEIDQFFEKIRQHKLYELDYLLKLKYKNAVERLRLINLAVEPFITLIRNQLPDLCCRVILSFLSRSDLKNVIALEEL